MKLTCKPLILNFNEKAECTDKDYHILVNYRIAGDYEMFNGKIKILNKGLYPDNFHIDIKLHNNFNICIKRVPIFKNIKEIYGLIAKYMYDYNLECVKINNVDTA